MEKKNLALEALRKLINDSIRSRSKANVVQTKSFSERLENAVARYHANAITTAEVLQELIQLWPRTSGRHASGANSLACQTKKSPSTTPWPRTIARCS